MNASTTADPVALSKEFLQAARQGEGEETAARLASLDESSLDALEESGRFAFWTNVYNATAQYRLRADPDQFDRRSFFGRSLITVAGQELSLDEIEHGILRHSKWKLGLGYIPTLFPSAFEKRHRVAEVDRRIHFVLNCGAASCPAIAGYDADTLDEQFDQATKLYLDGTVEYDPEQNHATVPRLCLWYRGDFGGRSGIRQLLREYDCVPEDSKPSFSYADYDWSLDLDAFRE